MFFVIVYYNNYRKHKKSFLYLKITVEKLLLILNIEFYDVYMILYWVNSKSFKDFLNSIVNWRYVLQHVLQPFYCQHYKPVSIAGSNRVSRMWFGTREVWWREWMWSVTHYVPENFMDCWLWTFYGCSELIVDAPLLWRRF